MTTERTPAEAITRAREHDKERNELDWYFAPFLEEWLDLNFTAGLLDRDDHARGYAYEHTASDEVVFYSPASSDDGYRGDYEPLDEKYIGIPISFITGDGDTHRAELAEKISARKKSVEEAARAWQEAHSARIE